MKENFTFEIGEKALDIYDREVEIIGKALRPENWTHREQYLVRRRSLWGYKHEWILQASLTKILTNDITATTRQENGV